jgi:NADH:ubiquinone oxidoreductase subunit 3 (subunit A)
MMMMMMMMIIIIIIIIIMKRLLLSIQEVLGPNFSTERGFSWFYSGCPG